MDDVTESPLDALERAIKAVGGPTAMGRSFDPPISGEAVISWRKGGVPANRVIHIETTTQVSRHLLRPDIYPLEREAAE